MNYRGRESPSPLKRRMSDRRRTRLLSCERYFEAPGGTMLTAEENERLTHVGPGTPMGELMRRYWHPIAGSSQLDDEPVVGIRLLGEDLVLYRDRGGRLGLLGEHCPHRKASLEYGIPE